MNIVKLIRLAPTLVLVAFLSYGVYSVQSSLPASNAAPSELGKGLEMMVEDAIDSSAATARILVQEGLRDPFQVGSNLVALAAAFKPADASKPQKDASSDPESDPLAATVAGLTLDATFLQGRDQLAIIGGRIYSQGQHLRIGDNGGNSGSPLFVMAVNESKVILKGNGKHYVLSYPDQLGRRKDEAHGVGSPMSQEGPTDLGGQLALLQKLLGSSLGVLGKSGIGNQSPGGPTARPASSPRVPPGTRSGN